MKKLFLIISVSLILCGCPDNGDSIEYKYSIVNNSGKTIEIIPFFTNVKDISNKILITNGNRLEKKLISDPPYNSDLSMKKIISSNGNLTGVEIAFNNEKKILYNICNDFICNNPRNIFDYINNNEQTETYIITPEDYQNAVDCGGNCN
jgi:hypothetical protein